jgi:hypothetical protein
MLIQDILPPEQIAQLRKLAKTTKKSAPALKQRIKVQSGSS